MPKTLIIGATGHLGQELIRACRQQGQEVHALVRHATLGDGQKMMPLRANGVTVHEGDLTDRPSLLAACRAVDFVVSALGSFQIGEQLPIVQAAQEARVKRLIPSDFGLDPKAAGPGSCTLFDFKRTVQDGVKAAGVPYTFIHTGGFFSYWVLSLGDMSKFDGRPLPPSEVNVYGDGNTKGTFASVADIADVTARAIADAEMTNRELHVAVNPTTQNELIGLWEKLSNRRVARVPVSAADLERVIASSTAPEQGMQLVGAQLHRSMWVRGDATKNPAGAADAAKIYPDLKFQSIADWLRPHAG